MPARSLSETYSTLFPTLDREHHDSTQKRESVIRARDRAAGWRQQIARAYSYQYDRTRTQEGRAELDAAYETMMQERPDFARIHRGSAFDEVKRKPFNAREAQEIMRQARQIERGTYANRQKGEHGGVIGKSALRVLEVMLFVIWPICRKGIFPSLAHIADKAQLSVRTVQMCLAVLRLMGFLSITRRMKRVATALGQICQQDTNAYLLHLAQGLGAIGAGLFGCKYPDGKKIQARESIYNLFGIEPANQPFLENGAGLVAPPVF